jgi:hypothetical protein
MSYRPHQMDEQNDCPGSSTRRGNSAASTASRMRASRRAYLPAAAMTGSPIARGGASPHRPTRCANLTPRTDWNAGLLLRFVRVSAAVARRDGAGGALGIAPGCRRRDGSMRRSLGSRWGIATGVRIRAAATNRNPPKPYGPRSTGPRATIKACQGKRRHDPVGAVDWRRLAAMCRF